jgi:hypothetical protein
MCPEMSVVTWKRCSNIGRTPPTTVAVTIPLPMASALWIPSNFQSIVFGERKSIGPIMPKVSDSSQIAMPTPKPARISLLRFRTWSVR